MNSLKIYATTTKEIVKYNTVYLVKRDLHEPSIFCLYTKDESNKTEL